MTGQQFAATIGLVLGYTFVFDVIDLQPRVGSFGFLRGLTYWFYLTFRALLGVLASLLVFEISPDLEIPIVALIAVLASVTILQNLAMNIGGNDIAKLSNLVDNYRDRMVDEEVRRRARRDESWTLRIQQELVKALNDTELEAALRQMLLQAEWDGAKINEHIQKLKDTAGTNTQYLDAMMAFQIADMNLEHARFLLAQKRLQAPKPRP